MISSAIRFSKNVIAAVCGALVVATVIPGTHSALAAEQSGTTLFQALKEAERSSPRLKGANYSFEAAEQQILSAKSGYLPSLDAAAIASTGNLGSFSLLGVDSNLSATNRIGEGAGLILKQNIWDFGRTSSAVEAAKSSREFQGKEAEVFRTDVDQQVLQTYLQCSFLKAEIEDSRFTAQQAKIVARETNKYVNSGQRSVVERDLVDAQAKEAETLTAVLTEKIKLIQQRLAIQLGSSSSEEIICSGLDGRETEIAALEQHLGPNPLIQAGAAQAQVAQKRVEQAKAERNPQLVGVVNGGYFNDDHLRTNWNYAAGVGITVPVFSGYRLEAQVGRYQAEAQAQEAALEYTNQSVNEMNSRFDEQIQSTQVRLASLADESRLAESAFNLARKRYFSLQGTMVDLREALRNLDRIKISIDEARRDLLIARGGRALFNGAKAD